MPVRDVDPLEYYESQSPITDPGKYVELLTDLPDNIPGLCEVAQSLIIHFQEDERFDYEIPKERMSEASIRYVEKMLARIVALDDRSLTEMRPPEKLLVGCCRDFATLFCAMARHQGIPTRVRVGFEHYDPASNFRYEHVIAECWDTHGKYWRMVDPMTDDQHIKECHPELPPYGVPPDEFLSAGLVWQMCRSGEADPDEFGQVFVDGTLVKGLWYIQQKLSQDLASQNKAEMLLWDEWGLIHKGKQPLTEDELALLDKIATLSQGRYETFAEMRTVYGGDSRLKVPSNLLN